MRKNKYIAFQRWYYISNFDKNKQLCYNTQPDGGDIMAYYFMVSKKKGEYTPLDIKKTPYFTKTSKFNGYGMSLYEADSFTMMFDNEAELRGALVKEGVLSYSDIGCPLSIRNLNKNKYNKVMYDFLYQKDIEFVMDPKKIITYIQDKLYEGDYRFILEYGKTFKDFYDCSSTAPEVCIFANNCIVFNNLDKHLLIRDENNDDMLTRMTKLLIYEYYQIPNGKIIYKDKIKYRNLHTIIAFINNYNKKYGLENNEDNRQISLLTGEGKTKALKKGKKEYIPGQINLFDEENSR